MARVPEGFGVRTRGMRRQGPVDRFDESVGEDLSVARRSGDAGAVPEAMDAMLAESQAIKGTRSGGFPAVDSTRAERDAFRDELLAVVIPVMLGLVGGGGAMGGAGRAMAGRSMNFPSKLTQNFRIPPGPTGNPVNEAVRRGIVRAPTNEPAGQYFYQHPTGIINDRNLGRIPNWGVERAAPAGRLTRAQIQRMQAQRGNQSIEEFLRGRFPESFGG